MLLATEELTIFIGQKRVVDKKTICILDCIDIDILIFELILQ